MSSGHVELPLGPVPAATLAAKLFNGKDAWASMPCWADGGEAPAAPFAPSRHLLAAFPDRVHSLRVSQLEHRELAAWLRAHTLAEREPGAIHVVALAYDAGRNLERIDDATPEDPPLPDVVVARYPAHASADGPGGPWTVHAIHDRAAQRLRLALRKPAAEPLGLRLPDQLVSRMSRAGHGRAIAEVLAGIEAGDLYEANVSRRLEAPCLAAAAPDLYRSLRAVNPAAFGALWAIDEALWLASSSPECLLRWEPHSRLAQSFPIKGTRRRGPPGRADDEQRRSLLADPKERAEHVMIVDLVRNDLGRVAEPGGVSVPRLFASQTLPGMHHMVSEIAAVVAPEYDVVDVLTALFPGGSITGAPKIAAMNRIDAVEGVRRGFYTGSLGFIDDQGGATFNILIRTCVMAGGRLLYQTGGAIVADSDPAREWEETEIKAAQLLEALNATA